MGKHIFPNTIIEPLQDKVKCNLWAHRERKTADPMAGGFDNISQDKKEWFPFRGRWRCRRNGWWTGLRWCRQT